MIVGLHQHAHQGLHVLVSPSDDGGIAKKLLTRFGYRVIRGSTSRHASRALREMLGVLDEGESVVVTPDGPRGPRHSMNSGVAYMARVTGLEIVPIGLACDNAWRLRSWDRFTIPKPFARVAITYGKPLAVACDACDDQLELATTEVKTRLIDAERTGFAQLGSGVDF